MRIGMGYDVHRLIEGRELILGGVNIPYDKGLLGHSDADVVTHVIMDALLGAAALGDIGRHFPDTSPEFKDVSSIELLKHVKKLIDDKFYLIENIDVTIMCEKPKLANIIPEMEKKIADVLSIDEDQINIKATTEEGLGFVGEGLGISAQAICLLESVMNYQIDVTPSDRGCSGCGGCPKR